VFSGGKNRRLKTFALGTLKALSRQSREGADKIHVDVVTFVLTH
jgi:hypothetical protein